MKKSVFALALFAVAAMCAVAFAGSVPDVLHLAHIEMPQSSDYISLAMTTLAVNLPRAYEQGDRNDLPMIAADIIYEGAAVGVVAGTGYAQPIATTNVFAGFAEAKADNSAGAAGDVNVRVICKGEIELPVTGAVITSFRAPVYATDDNTFTTTASTNVFIGYIKRFVSTARAVVAFDATKSQSPT